MALTNGGDIAVCPIELTNNERAEEPKKAITACAVNLPGIRFLCTLEENAVESLHNVRAFLDQNEVTKKFLSVTKVFLDLKGAAV